MFLEGRRTGEDQANGCSEQRGKMLKQRSKGLCFEAVRIIDRQQEALTDIQTRGELIFQLAPKHRRGSLKIEIEAKGPSQLG